MGPHADVWVNPTEGMSEARLSAESKEREENGEGLIEEQKVGRSPLGEGNCGWTRKPAVLDLKKNETY